MLKTISLKKTVSIPRLKYKNIVRIYDKEFDMYFGSEKNRQQFSNRIAEAEKNIKEGNGVIIPKFGFKGAAFATGLSYVFLFYIKSIISNKYFYIELKLPKITLLIAATTIFSLYNSYYSFNIISVLMYLFCLLMIVVLYRNSIRSGFIYIKQYLKNFIA